MTGEPDEASREAPAVATARGPQDLGADYRSTEVAVAMSRGSIALAGIAVACLIGVALLPFVGIIESSNAVDALIATVAGVLGAGEVGVLLGQRRVLRRWRDSLTAAGVDPEPPGRRS